MQHSFHFQLYLLICLPALCNSEIPLAGFAAASAARDWGTPSSRELRLPSTPCSGIGKSRTKLNYFKAGPLTQPLCEKYRWDLGVFLNTPNPPHPHIPLLPAPRPHGPERPKGCTKLLARGKRGLKSISDKFQLQSSPSFHLAARTLRVLFWRARRIPEKTGAGRRAQPPDKLLKAGTRGEGRELAGKRGGRDSSSKKKRRKGNIFSALRSQSPHGAGDLHLTAGCQVLPLQKIPSFLPAAQIYPLWVGNEICTVFF